MKITVCVDIMGGDNPYTELASGALAAAKEFKEDGLFVVMVGTEEARASLSELPENVRFVTANSVVEMTDEPGCVMKEKSDSSLATAVKLCRDGEADAVVSASNTGALFTASSLIIRRIKGCRRAALGSVIPLEKPFVMLDCGANIDCTPEILALYARMGSVYAENVLGIKSPRVALLNNGGEPHKGTPVYVDTYALLSNDKSINFVGNCEGKALPFGACDVLVCDGFTGNITLKLIEGMGKFMSKSIKGIFYKNALTKVAGLLTKKQTTNLKKSLDISEYGGAPFLGLAKPVIKAHGSSDAYSFRSAIKQAMLYCQSGTIEKMTAAMAKKTTEEPAE
ncbi:MAG: phosphate acyltransferase PlsX [Clostridia bacterium]|nr:phosphate acyltransferase PlsX [Clostridia bacterium]